MPYQADYGTVLNNPFIEALWTSQVSDSITALGVTNERVVVVTDEVILAASTRTGRLAWEVDRKAWDISPREACKSLGVSRKSILLVSQSHLLSLNARSGELEWKRPASLVSKVLAHKDIMAAVQQNALVAMRPDTGGLSWSFQPSEEIVDVVIVAPMERFRHFLMICRQESRLKFKAIDGSNGSLLAESETRCSVPTDLLQSIMVDMHSEHAIKDPKRSVLEISRLIEILAHAGEHESLGSLVGVHLGSGTAVVYDGRTMRGFRDSTRPIWVVNGITLSTSAISGTGDHVCAIDTSGRFHLLSTQTGYLNGIVDLSHQNQKATNAAISTHNDLIAVSCNSNTHLFRC